MTDYSELLKKRRSIRDYEDREVPLEIVKEIISESCLAPSSGNRQSWRFIIVKNREIIRRLSDESKKNLLADLERNSEPARKKYEERLRDPDYNVFHNAPCLVYFLGQKDIHSLDVDCALAACHFMFSAVEKGLGTCWIGLGKFIQDPDLRRLIGMPDDFRIVAPIIIGYPKFIPEPTEREAPQILKVVL